MNKSDLLLFQEQEYFQQFINKEGVVFHDELTSRQNKLNWELKDYGAMQIARYSKPDAIEQFLAYNLDINLVNNYCQEKVDSLSMCRLGIDLQVKIILKLLYADYLNNRNFKTIVNEEILGPFKSTIKLSEDTQDNKMHKVQFNNVIHELERQEYINILGFRFDPKALPRPLLVEKEALAKVKNNFKIKLDYYPAKYSQYTIEYTDKFLSLDPKSFEDRVIQLVLDQSKGLLYKNGEMIDNVGIKSNVFKVFVEWANNDGVLITSKLFPKLDDCDFRSDLKKELKRKTHLEGGNIVNKDGLITLQNCKISLK